MKRSKQSPKYELASQQKQKALKHIQDIFFEKILGIEESLVTDESYLSDFIAYPPEKAIREGVEPGTFIFIEKRYCGPRFDKIGPESSRALEMRNPDNWETIEVESEPGLSRAFINSKTIEVFGVDITPVCSKYLVDIFLHIAQNCKGKKALNYGKEQN